MGYEFESLALFVFIVVLAAGLEVWNRMSEAGRNIMATLDSPAVKSDEQQVAEDLAYRNRAIYEADHYNESASMEPFCGGAERRSREAIDKALKAARDSLAKKPPRQSSYQAPRDDGIPSAISMQSLMGDSSSSLRLSFSGGGGSFDGGGASGDWGGSTSSSSSSSDCSSSSSDSGSSSCGSSD